MKKSSIPIIIRTIIVVMTLFAFYTYFNVDIPGGKSVLKYVTSVVTKADGTVISDGNYYFGKLSKGDKVDITVNIPVEEKILDASLCFYTCHDTVRAWYEDELLFESGEELAKRGNIIGAVYPVIVLPEDSWGQDIHIQLNVMENNPFYKLSSLLLISSRYAYTFVIRQNVFGFFVAIAGFTLGLILFGMYFINGWGNRQSRKGCYIALFIMSMTLWIFSSNGYNTLISKSHIWIIIEYISIFFVSTPLLLYFLEEPLKPLYKKICRVKIVINMTFIIGALILNNLNIIHLCNVLIYAHILLAMDAALFLIFVMRKDTYTEVRKDALMKIGFWLLLLYGMLDIIRYNLAKYTNATEMEASFAYLPFGITLFTLCFFMAYLAETHDMERAEQEKIYFQYMAYIDPLTKINNRMKINELFSKMKKDGIKRFGIVSCDLNKLKETNDNKGHQAGDQLICGFANLLSTHVKETMTIGRVGGDEFIIIANGDDADKLDDIAKSIRDDGSALDPPISFSYGIAYSDEDNPHTLDDVYKEADHRMYEMKKAMNTKRI